MAQAHEFMLQDQFDQTHVYRFPHPQVSVLVMADRRGSRQLKAWIQPIYERFEKRINIGGVAELSRVPRFARGLARRFLRQRLSYPVMLDWTGKVTRRYDYQQGQVNLFGACSHISGQVSSKARCDVAIRFNRFQRPAL
jgi:hypothetical protein